MSTIAKLLIQLGVDTKEAEAKLTTFGGKAQAGLRKGLAPSVAVLGMVGLAAKHAADDASDLGESQNAVNVVFGKSSVIVNDFAKVAARQAGLSMRQLNELVTPVGAALQNFGMSAKEAASNSVNLAKRAADMASVFNTSVPEAMEAIQAGLRGEADPLERFGVNLSAAAVKAKGMAMGLTDASGNLDKHGEAQARVALLMEQTNKLQGDFVKTSGEAANKARINAAEADNLSASYGKGLLPVLKMVRSTVGALLGLMANHTTTTKVVVGVVAGLAAAVVVANGVMRAWATTTAVVNAVMAANPIVLVVAALALLVVGLVVAWKHSEKFRAVVTAAFGGVKAAALAVAGFVTKTIPEAFQRVKSWMVAHWPEIATIISGPFAPLVGLATNAFGIRSRFQAAMTSVKNFARGRLEDIVGFVRSLPGRLVGLAARAGAAILSGIGQGLSSLGSKLVSWIVSPVNYMIGKINGLIGRINSAMSFSVDTHVPGVGKVGFDAPDIRSIPMLAKGGLVTGPTLAMIGEAGPEAVVPLNRAGGGLGGSITIVVEDHTMAGMTPEQRRSLARQLAPELKARVALGF